MRVLHETPQTERGAGIRAERYMRVVKKQAGQDGYVLIGVLFLVFLVLVALSIAAPKMAASIERDREVELQHRAKQYVRAIKLYYKRFGAYPPTLDALVKTNEIRFLRRRYKDSVTGKDDWKLIHFGQNKLPTAYGFFGQPMAGSSIAGIGPGGAGTMMNGSNSFGNNGSSFGSSGLGSGGLNSGGLSSGNPGSISSAPTTGSTDNSGNPTSSGSTGSSSGSTGSGTSSGSSDGSSSGQSGSSSGFGAGSSNGQIFGGGGIIGVESTSPKLAILQYKKKTHFNEWEFVYDPMADQMILSNNTNIGTPAGGQNTNGIATPGTFSGQQPSSGLPQQQQQQPQPQQPTPPQQQQ